MSQKNMLHEFIVSNRLELIARCEHKAMRTASAGSVPWANDNGIATFLDQLAETLREEESSRQANEVTNFEVAPGNNGIGVAAAKHGADLLRRGFTVDQVVHDYGNVCQSVTELAIEGNVPLSTHEFRTLNRCLDNAIADAVKAFALGGQQSAVAQAEVWHERANALSDEHRRLTDIAIQSFSAIKTGNIGATGATGALLMHALGELRLLAEAPAKVRKGRSPTATHH